MKKHRQMTLFMHIVDCGSISKAAEKLDLSKSVLSSALKQLEQELSVTLLKRTTRKQILTPHGERFYQHCLRMNEIVDNAWQEIITSHSLPSGNLTVTAPHALMESIIAPLLCRTFSAFSEVSLTLIADDHQLDLMQHDIDLAIRVGESAESNYRQRRVGSFKDVLCKARSQSELTEDMPYIANQWQGKLVEHRLTHSQTGEAQLMHFNPKHRVNTINQVANLISLEMGVGIVPEFLLANYPKIVACEPEYQLPAVPLYVLHPYQRKPPQTVIMAIDSIAKHFLPV